MLLVLPIWRFLTGFTGKVREEESNVVRRLSWKIRCERSQQLWDKILKQTYHCDPLRILCARKWSFCRASLFSQVQSFSDVFCTSLCHHVPGGIHLLDDEFLRLDACLPAGPSRIILQYGASWNIIVHHYLCNLVQFDQSLIIPKLFDHFDHLSMLWPRDALLLNSLNSHLASEPVPFSQQQPGLPMLKAAVCCLEVPTVRYAETICIHLLWES